MQGSSTEDKVHGVLNDAAVGRIAEQLETEAADKLHGGFGCHRGDRVQARVHLRTAASPHGNVSGGDMDAVTQTEIGGLRVFTVDAPHPTVALWFRAGFADETLGTRGLAHLCEHLALSPFQTAAYEYNGMTDVLHKSSMRAVRGTTCCGHGAADRRPPARTRPKGDAHESGHEARPMDGESGVLLLGCAGTRR